MFKQQLHAAFDNISPSPELLDRISAMMSEEATRKKPPIQMQAVKYGGIAAAIMLAIGGTVLFMQNSGRNDIKTAEGTMPAVAAGQVYDGVSAAENASETAEQEANYAEAENDTVEMAAAAPQAEETRAAVDSAEEPQATTTAPLFIMEGVAEDNADNNMPAADMTEDDKSEFFIMSENPTAEDGDMEAAAEADEDAVCIQDLEESFMIMADDDQEAEDPHTGDNASEGRINEAAFVQAVGTSYDSVTESQSVSVLSDVSAKYEYHTKGKDVTFEINRLMSDMMCKLAEDVARHSSLLEKEPVGFDGGHTQITLTYDFIDNENETHSDTVVFVYSGSKGYLSTTTVTTGVDGRSVTTGPFFYELTSEDIYYLFVLVKQEPDIAAGDNFENFLAIEDRSSFPKSRVTAYLPLEDIEEYIAEDKRNEIIAAVEEITGGAIKPAKVVLDTNERDDMTIQMYFDPDEHTHYEASFLLWSDHGYLQIIKDGKTTNYILTEKYLDLF